MPNSANIPSPELGEVGARPEGRALLLVVERNPHIQSPERYFLEEAGCALEFAADGTQGLERDRTLQPHLLGSEILLHRMDGT